MSTFVTFFRHGESSNKEAVGSGLTQKGICQVEKNAHTLSISVSHGSHVVLYSSPRARAQDTMGIVSRVIAEQGVSVPGTYSVISGLDEVQGFTWDPLLRSLVKGGAAVFSDDIYEIDPAITNPLSLSAENYFDSDFCHNPELFAEARTKLPAGYLLYVDAMETAKSVTKRFIDVLRMFEGYYGGTSTHVIMAGHYASTVFAVETFSGGTINGLDTGESMDMILFDGKLFVTRVGALTLGCSHEDLFSLYDKGLIC